jgi:hypothetical protein
MSFFSPLPYPGVSLLFLSPTASSSIKIPLFPSLSLPSTGTGRSGRLQAAAQAGEEARGVEVNAGAAVRAGRRWSAAARRWPACERARLRAAARRH